MDRGPSLAGGLKKRLSTPYGCRIFTIVRAAAIATIRSVARDFLSPVSMIIEVSKAIVVELPSELVGAYVL